MILRRFLVLLLLVLAPIPVVATPAWACSCAEGSALADAELAFNGVVRSVEADGRTLRVTFGVETVVKGVAGTAVTLTTSDEETACGYRFDSGGRYRVYAAAGQTSLCSGNELLAAGSGDGDRADRAGTSRTVVFWAGSGLVLLIVAGTLTWLLRFPRSR